MTAELEARLVGFPGAAKAGTSGSGGVLSGMVGSNQIDFNDAQPIDVVSPFKSSRNNYDIFRGLIVPYLTIERATYRYGVGQNATKQFSLRGDTIIFAQGQPYVYEQPFVYNAGGVTYTLPHTGVPYVEGADTLYAYSAILINSANGTYKRLFYDGDESITGAGYWNTSSTGITVGGSAELNQGFDTIRFTYASTTTTDYTQLGLNPSGFPVHEPVTDKPAAVRGHSTKVYVGTPGASGYFDLFSGVQTAEVNWSVSLEKDEELGNKRTVSQEYDVPEVSGSLSIKPSDTADLWAKLARITGVPSNQSIGPNSSVPVPLEIQSLDDAGNVLQTVYVPDARFTPPGLSAQVQQKLEVTFDFKSDGGELYAYNGSRR